MTVHATGGGFESRLLTGEADQPVDEEIDKRVYPLGMKGSRSLKEKNGHVEVISIIEDCFNRDNNERGNQDTGGES